MVDAPAPPAPYAATSALVSIIGTGVTAAAVLVGAIWAYYKFVRGRTFKPRLRIEAQAEWLTQFDQLFIHARVCLTNIGASKISVVQQGTGLRISTLQPGPTGSSTRWRRLSTVAIVEHHSWIEPSETISDDVLIGGQGAKSKGIVRLETRVVCERKRNTNIAVSQIVIVPADAVISDRKA